MRGRRFREFWELMDDLAAPFRGKAAIQSFQHQTWFDGDEAAATGNACGDLRKEAIQTADHEIQPRTAFIHVIDGRKDRLHAVVRVDICVVQISRIVRKIFARQPNCHAVFGDALLRHKRDKFLLLPIPVDTDKRFKLRARFHLASEKADDGAQQLLRNARKSRAKAGSYL